MSSEEGVDDSVDDDLPLFAFDDTRIALWSSCDVISLENEKKVLFGSYSSSPNVFSRRGRGSSKPEIFLASVLRVDLRKDSPGDVHRFFVYAVSYD